MGIGARKGVARGDGQRRVANVGIGVVIGVGTAVEKVVGKRIGTGMGPVEDTGVGKGVAQESARKCTQVWAEGCTVLCVGEWAKT